MELIARQVKLSARSFNEGAIHQSVGAHLHFAENPHAMSTTCLPGNLGLALCP